MGRRALLNRRRRRRRPRLLAGTAVGLVAAAAGPFAWYHALTFDDGGPTADALLLLDDEPETIAAAARLVADHPGRVVYPLTRSPRQVESLGIVPTSAERIGGGLEAAGVAPDGYRVLTGVSERPGEMIAAADGELRAAGVVNVTALSTATHSRFWRSILDDVLPPRRAAAYRMRPIEDPDIAAHNWFTDRIAAKKFVSRTLRLIWTTTR